MQKSSCLEHRNLLKDKRNIAKHVFTCISQKTMATKQHFGPCAQSLWAEWVLIDAVQFRMTFGVFWHLIEHNPWIGFFINPKIVLAKTLFWPWAKSLWAEWNQIATVHCRMTFGVYWYHKRRIPSIGFSVNRKTVFTKALFWPWVKSLWAEWDETSTVHCRMTFGVY